MQVDMQAMNGQGVDASFMQSIFAKAAQMKGSWRAKRGRETSGSTPEVKKTVTY